ncbi:MAG: Nif3-like dinuclear metal center hexameric protein [Gammaproteobacteria bacterium]|nr:Nif3-like dinuclear metal center hexameric protein [Gammaproteobacteria bacterium]
MVQLSELIRYSNTLMEIERYQDYCPNGLQIEGRAEVSKIVSGVTASQALIDAAVKERADLLLVHHGYFWKGEEQVISGIKRKRIKTLLDHDISLLAYHLPLDGHTDLGNNTHLAKLWGFDVDGRFGEGVDGGLGLYSDLPKPMKIGELIKLISSGVEREVVHLPGGDEMVRRVGWCSGGADGYFEAAIAAGCDLYITGEVSEPSFHIAQELGAHFIGAGHHATERGGVRQLGEHLAEMFSVEHRFIDIPNPV